MLEGVHGCWSMLVGGMEDEDGVEGTVQLTEEERKCDTEIKPCKA